MEKIIEFTKQKEKYKGWRKELRHLIDETKTKDEAVSIILRDEEKYPHLKKLIGHMSDKLIDIFEDVFFHPCAKCRRHYAKYKTLWNNNPEWNKKLCTSCKNKLLEKQRKLNRIVPQIKRIF
jgi:hypothetical protein